MRDARARFGSITFEQVLALAQTGVDGEYIESMRAAGLRDASVDELVRMKVHDVDADYIRDLENLKNK